MMSALKDINIAPLNRFCLDHVILLLSTCDGIGISMHFADTRDSAEQELDYEECVPDLTSVQISWIPQAFKYNALV